MKPNEIFSTDLSEGLVRFGKSYLADVLKIGLLLGLSSSVHGTALLGSQAIKSILTLGQKLLGRHSEMGKFLSETMHHVASRLVRVLQWVAYHPLMEKMVEKATTWLKAGFKHLCAKFFGPSLLNAYVQSSSQERADEQDAGLSAAPEKLPTIVIEEVVEVAASAPAIETRLQLQQMVLPANQPITDWYFDRTPVQQPALPGDSPADLEEAQEIAINPFGILPSLIDSAVGIAAEMISDVVLGPKSTQPLSAVETLMNSRTATPAVTSVVSRI